MSNARPRRGWRIRGAVAIALLIAALARSVPARADLYSALDTFKKGDYPSAFQQFLALARLGQPLAELDVAYLYFTGQGTTQSDIHAYAWAMLAASDRAGYGSPG